MLSISLLSLLYKFKKDIMCYRKGNYIYSKYHTQCSMQHASDFPARLIGSVAIGVIVMISLFTIVLTPLAMKEF